MAFGKKIEVNLQRDEHCPKCSGTGAKEGSGLETCPSCGGTGQVSRTQGFFTIATTCNRCRGSGKVIKDYCPVCRGSGLNNKKRRIVLDIEPGFENGTVLRLQGEGNAGPNSGPNGDLIIVVHEKPHPNFLRKGNDVICQIPISVYQAILGANIKVPTLDGKTVRITVPPGTQSGRTFRLRKEGVPYLKRRGRGDQLVKVIVRIPENISAQEKRAIEELTSIKKDTDSPHLLNVRDFENR